MTRRHFTFVAEVHLVLPRGPEQLLLLRQNTGYMDGHWSLVAGHVDGNETFREAMAREAREEAGLDLPPDTLDLVHMMHRLSDRERISLFFTPRIWHGTPRNMEPEKCAALEWRAALPDNTIPYIRRALAHIAQGTSYSEFGW